MPAVMHQETPQMSKGSFHPKILSIDILFSPKSAQNGAFGHLGELNFRPVLREGPKIGNPEHATRLLLKESPYPPGCPKLASDDCTPFSGLCLESPPPGGTSNPWGLDCSLSQSG
eukprot:EG_transcript_44178